MIKAITTSPSDARDAALDFADFVGLVEARLRRAFVGVVGVDDAHDAAAEALAWAWEHWAEVAEMENPAGYLYRVGRSRFRHRRPARVRYLVDEPAGLPDIEPSLPDALRSLPDRQRTVVWLVYACEWTYGEVAEALGISASAVGTHASRGLSALRNSIGESDG